MLESQKCEVLSRARTFDRDEAYQAVENAKVPSTKGPSELPIH